MENINAIVGKNLATLRKSRGLTQQELAYEIHYSDKSISKWELGYSCPSVDILKDIADYFGVNVDYLISDHDGEPVPTEDKKEVDARRANKITTVALTVTTIILIGLASFFSGLFFSAGEPVARPEIFIWLLPISLVASFFECLFFFRNKVLNVILVSAAVWTLLLAFCFHFRFFAAEPQNIWIILTVGAPVQVIILLVATWKKSSLSKD